jgi:hypothetical protein
MSYSRSLGHTSLAAMLESTELASVVNTGESTNVLGAVGGGAANCFVPQPNIRTNHIVNEIATSVTDKEATRRKKEIKDQMFLKQPMNEEAFLTGRERICTLIDKLDASCDDCVSLQDLQNAYEEAYNDKLNQETLKKFFPKHQIKEVFTEYLGRDIDLYEDQKKPGSLYFKLQQPLDEILADIKNIRSHRRYLLLYQNQKKEKQQPPAPKKKEPIPPPQPKEKYVPVLRPVVPKCKEFLVADKNQAERYKQQAAAVEKTLLEMPGASFNGRSNNIDIATNDTNGTAESKQLNILKEYKEKQQPPVPKKNEPIPPLPPKEKYVPELRPLVPKYKEIRGTDKNQAEPYKKRTGEVTKTLLEMPGASFNGRSIDIDVATNGAADSKQYNNITEDKESNLLSDLVASTYKKLPSQQKTLFKNSIFSVISRFET